MKTLALLVFELFAHYQLNQWADNSKTKRARVFILVHDTYEVSFRYLVRFKSFGNFRELISLFSQIVHVQGHIGRF